MHEHRNALRRHRPTLYELYLTNITLKIGLIQARAEMPAVLDAIATGALDPGPVVDHILGWEDAISALSEVREKLVFTRPMTRESPARTSRIAPPVE